MIMPDLPKGLYNKYIVKKTYGETDPDAIYIVLRPDKDQHARDALLEYARLIRNEQPKFAEELTILLLLMEEGAHDLRESEKNSCGTISDKS
jgi:hypothetical protein